MHNIVCESECSETILGKIEKALSQEIKDYHDHNIKKKDMYDRIDEEYDIDYSAKGHDIPKKEFLRNEIDGCL